MRFTIPAEAIKSALSRIDKIIEKRQVIPVLGHVHCEARSGLITLTGSNLDTTIAIDVEADVAEPGVGCIPAADFLKLATAARKAMISIEATANVAVVRFAPHAYSKAEMAA